MTEHVPSHRCLSSSEVYALVLPFWYRLTQVVQPMLSQVKQDHFFRLEELRLKRI